MFYMEEAGEYELEPERQAAPPAPASDGHMPGCFGLEEERGEGWDGAGAMRQLIREARPTL